MAKPHKIQQNEQQSGCPGRFRAVFLKNEMGTGYRCRAPKSAHREPKVSVRARKSPIHAPKASIPALKTPIRAPKSIHAAPNPALNAPNSQSAAHFILQSDKAQAKNGSESLMYRTFRTAIFYFNDNFSTSS
ncbi:MULTISPECIES: hypothetical protein [unclassified Sporosarcina]|uniref:hypothetical protein n=1 Tax=unclassified Sporosarcina TaxID=2647733 RepID=UPI002040F802|nr:MULTISPECIES: hypothetical protein [unclassified Sporosarcina]